MRDEQVSSKDTRVSTLGPCEVRSPLLDLLRVPEDRVGLIRDDYRVLVADWLYPDDDDSERLSDRPSFEGAGPRKRIYFEPTRVHAGIVTCGGLCPGLNDVIRGLVHVLWHRYGVRQIDGFRFGYAGLVPDSPHEPMPLDADRVSTIHEDGGTILGTSRGPQDPAEMVAGLKRRGVNVLFVIGGDGTLRGGLAIAAEARRQGVELAVIGVPKTIDNDILFVEQSFGFQTAFAEAGRVIRAAHTEARSAANGVGLVKLMGRESGFIACHAALACNDVNYVLIPEVPFPLEGDQGLLASLEDRLARRDHAVIVVAEGAGQQYCATEGCDPSGNPRLGDIGLFLKQTIRDHFHERGRPVNLKYIDPSYTLRGIPATPHDSVYCFRLAQNAVHAAMAGRTDVVVGRWHNRFVHIPIELAVRRRQRVDPKGDLWLSVLESTGQPRWSVDDPAAAPT